MDGRSEAYHYHIILSVLVCVNQQIRQRRYPRGRFKESMLEVVKSYNDLVALIMHIMELTRLSWLLVFKTTI